MKVLETNNLTKRYGTNFAVNQVSMTIYEGDIYGFIGENGAGKTTFIRLVSGLIKKSGGKFTLFEGNKENIGAVVESPSIYLYMNAMDNLMAQGKMVGIEDVEKHKEMLKLVKLEYLIGSNKKAKDFSLGMRQRLGIAMALLYDPKLLLLDEPMNGLDPEGVVLMRGLIKSLSERGITFLISSHMLGELSKVATRYGFIHRGRLIKELTLEELKQETKAYVKLVVKPEDVEKTSQILEKENINFQSDSKTFIIIDKSITDIVLLLSKNNIDVVDINQESSGIENFYLSLLGGHHE